MIERNEGIIERRRDELLTEARKIGRNEAIGSILEFENEGRCSSSSGSRNKEIMDRWEKQLPENCPYEWDEIASITPTQRHYNPMDERWPRVVAPTAERCARNHLPRRSVRYEAFSGFQMRLGCVHCGCIVKGQGTRPARPRCLKKSNMPTAKKLCAGKTPAPGSAICRSFPTIGPKVKASKTLKSTSAICEAPGSGHAWDC